MTISSHVRLSLTTIAAAGAAAFAIGSATGGAGAGKAPQHLASLQWGAPVTLPASVHAINPQPLPPGE
jgi:hypothetical protein